MVDTRYIFLFSHSLFDLLFVVRFQTREMKEEKDSHLQKKTRPRVPWKQKLPPSKRELDDKGSDFRHEFCIGLVPPGGGLRDF